VEPTAIAYVLLTAIWHHTSCCSCCCCCSCSLFVSWTC